MRNIWSKKQNKQKQSKHGIQFFFWKKPKRFYNFNQRHTYTNYKKAIDYLEDGLEFILEDSTLENQFYKELIESNKNINNKNKEDYYTSKVEALAKKIK